MKTQLTTFILFAAMTTGCGADDLVALDNTQVMEIRDGIVRLATCV